MHSYRHILSSVSETYSMTKTVCRFDTVQHGWFIYAIHIR